MDIKKISTTICIPIEILKRDLEVKIFLGLKFLKFYDHVIVGAQHELLKYIKQNYNNNFIYVEKGLNYNDNDPTYNFLIQNNCRIVSLSEEGGIFDNYWFTLFESYVGQKAIKYIDLLFNWGPTIQKKLLDERESLNLSNTFITGHPRFDLCKKEFDLLNQYKLNKYYKSKKKYILIIGNFYESNMPINSFIEKIYNINMVLSGFRGKEIVNQLSTYRYFYRKILMDYFVDAAKEISKNIENINIVFRPHPAEKFKTYKKIFKNYKNIIVTNEGLVNEWINGCEVFIHHDCTSAMQAYFNGKKAISYAPIIDKNHAQLMTMDVSEVVDNDKKLINLIIKFLNNPEQKYHNNEKDKLVSNLINNINYSSADLIVKLVHENISIKKVENDTKSDHVKINKEFIKKNIIQKFTKLIFYPYIKKREEEKYPKINFEEINKTINFINTNYIHNSKLITNKYGKYSFILSNK